MVVVGSQLLTTLVVGRSAQAGCLSEYRTRATCDCGERSLTALLLLVLSRLFDVIFLLLRNLRGERPTEALLTRVAVAGVSHCEHRI